MQLPIENGNRNIMTDPKLLGELAYLNTANLDRRKALYRFTSPTYDIEDEVIKLANIQDNQSILDVGCGTGKLLLKASRANPSSRFFGIDISDGMFRDAKNQAGKEGLDVSFVRGDAQYLPFQSSAFDRVVAMHMLYHLPDIDKALAEIARVIKKNGVVIVTANSQYNREQLNFLKANAAKIMGRETFTDPNLRFNIENGFEALKRFFSDVVLTSFDSELHLSEVQPYLDYFDSLRSFWNPKPSDEEWFKVMQSTKQYVEDQIAQYGEFTDKLGFGAIIATNPLFNL